MAGDNPVTLPQSYVAKYNRFVDNILGRINKILRKNYDPVNVRLQTPTQTATDNNKKKGTTQKPKNKTKVESRERYVVVVVSDLRRRIDPVELIDNRPSVYGPYETPNTRL